MWKLWLILSFLFVSLVHSETMCIAHKGLHTHAPENSLSSLTAAIVNNTDGLEFDVQHTLDGIPILMHDKVLVRTAEDRPGKRCPITTMISKLTLEQIRRSCQLKGEEEIPTLKDALELLETYQNFVFIELKDHPTSITKALIEKHYRGRSDKLRVISFRPRNFEYFLAEEDSTTDGFWPDVKFLDLDVTPFGKNKGYGLNLFNRTYKLRKGYLRGLEEELSVWTVNLIPRIKYFLNENVDFITTDRPLECMGLKKVPKS